ncbi:MAG: DUF2335 domain-containing protein [Nitrospira sp.]|nr:DUF2335 domain-containing protein [Nitrospira sp.]
MTDQKQQPDLPKNPEGKRVIHRTSIEEKRVEFLIGPLPPSAELKKYDEIVPGLANRLMCLVENQQNIQAKEHDKILGNESKKINGSIIVSIFLILLAGFSLWLEYPEAAIIFGVSGPLSPVLRALAHRWFNGQG